MKKFMVNLQIRFSNTATNNQILFTERLIKGGSNKKVQNEDVLYIMQPFTGRRSRCLQSYC